MTDLISRADAIDAVWKLDKDANEYVVDDAKEIHGYCTAIGVCVGELSALPSADAVDVYKAHEEEHLTIINRIKELQYAIAKTQTIVGEMVESADAVHGEWIKTTSGNGWNEWYVLKCPLCDATIEDKQNRKWEYNYCPNCGARMTPYKGGDDE